MVTNYLFDKAREFSCKFKNFFKHKKKLLALQNYSDAVPFHHKDYLILIKRCMADEFLGEQEANFLTHMVDKYFVQYSYLDWTHKTKWLKDEMGKLSKQYEAKRMKQLEMFDLSKVPGVSASRMPLSLMTKSHVNQYVSG